MTKSTDSETPEAEVVPTRFKFNGIVKHGTLTFSPGIVYGFEDEDAVPYFTAMSWGEETTEEIQYLIPKSMVDVDPDTVFGDGPRKGMKVLEG